MTEPIKIAYLYPEHPAKPAARVLQMAATLRALAGAGVEVHFLVGKHSGQGKVLSDLGLNDIPGLHIHPVAMWQSGPGKIVPFSWHGRYYRAALARLNRLGVELVLVRHLKLAEFFLENWRRGGRKLVYEAHELFHQTAAENQMPPEKLDSLKQLELGVLGRADAVAAISAPLAEDVQPFMNSGAPLCLAPSGVGAEFFNIARDAVETDLGGYAGGLMPWKGVDLLIQALALTCRGRLEILGGRRDSGNWQRISSLAAEFGLGDRLVMRQAADQATVRELLGRAGVAVWPGSARSQIAARHTSPLKLFEYLAAGCAVLAPDLPAARSVLTPGENALLFKPDDPRSLAEGLERLWGDPQLARDLGRKGRELARSYTWEQRGLTLKDLFASLGKGA